MAAKKAKSTAPRRASCYTVQSGKATLAKKFCPRCGPGVIMAEPGTSALLFSITTSSHSFQNRIARLPEVYIPGRQPSTTRRR
jgi:hypothetical protein